tara:strand:- start:830 stop:1294 length:465 start_codon:yes stop_codon:yes gene_type:complete
MPVPAAAAAILSFIGRQGVTQAIKKFGKKAVDEARKHGKDMVTKPTPGQSKVKKAVSGQRANRETMRRTAGATGLAGYGAGKMSGGSEATKPKAKAKAKAKPKAKDPRTNPKDFPVYGKSTDSAKAFREAQRKAKRNGQKTFTFEGRRYNTTEK